MEASCQLAATITTDAQPVRYAVCDGIVGCGCVDGVRVYDLESEHAPPLQLYCDDRSPVLALAPASIEDGVGSMVLAAAGDTSLTMWVLRRHPAKQMAPEVARTLTRFEYATNHELGCSPCLGSETRSITFEAGAGRAALLVGTETWIWDIRRTSVRLCLRLLGDASPLSACAFGRLMQPLAGSTAAPVLLSAAEGREFKLWRLPAVASVSSPSILPEPPMRRPVWPPAAAVATPAAATEEEDGPLLLLRSALPPSGALLLCAALHPCAPQIVLGDAAGVVFVYELQASPREAMHALMLGCRCTQRVELARIAHTRALHDRGLGVERAARHQTPAPAAGRRAVGAPPPSTPPPAVLDSRPRWQQPVLEDAWGAAEATAEAAAELSGTLLALHYVRLPRRQAEQALMAARGEASLWASAVDASAASAYGLLAAVPGAPLLLRVGVWQPTVVPLCGEAADDAPADEVAGSCVINPGGLGGGTAALAQLHDIPLAADDAAAIAAELLQNGELRPGASLAWIARASPFQPRIRVWRVRAEGGGGGGGGVGVGVGELRGRRAESRGGADADDSGDLACLNCAKMGHLNGACPRPRRSAASVPFDQWIDQDDKDDRIAANEGGYAPNYHDKADAADAAALLSVLPLRAPLATSPLGRALAAVEAMGVPSELGKVAGAVAGAKLAVTGRLGATPATAPVTFHRKIASSGYGKPPVMKLHAGGPSTLAARAAAAAAAGGPVGKGGAAVLVRKYTPAEGPICHLQVENSSAPRPLDSAAIRLAFSPDASRIAIAAADGTAAIQRLPTRRHSHVAPPTLLGHRAAISSVHWSHSGRLLLTASADGSACLWDVAPDTKPPAAPLLRFDHLTHPPRPGAVPTTAEALSNPPLSTEVRGARFFYLDTFVLLAAGSGLHLYSYALGPRTPTHDATRAAELRHSYRLQTRWPLSRAHHITCFAAANSFLSPLALVAGSDRSIEVVDLGTGQRILELNDAHERPVQLLRLHEGSAAGDTPAAGHDLFLSAALDGAVKLWDLRSASCVRRLGAHVNRVHPIGAALSPCLRYVATGSEDRSAYLYDARSGGLIERLRHSDTVVDVAFSPLYPQLATCALDGSVRFYADRPEE